MKVPQDGSADVVGSTLGDHAVREELICVAHRLDVKAKGLVREPVDLRVLREVVRELDPRHHTPPATRKSALPASKTSRVVYSAPYLFFEITKSRSREACVPSDASSFTVSSFQK